VAAGTPVKYITRHMLGLFQGQPGARAWRRYLSEHAHLDDSEADILRHALIALQQTAAQGAVADDAADSAPARATAGTRQ
jgi:tRNA-dihydrouridine synthase A